MRAIMTVAPCRSRADRSMVGAAGFEPTTWSTQNSRATRLRYAPVMDASIQVSAPTGKARELPSAEHRMGDPVARPDPELPRGAADHLQHRPHRRARRYDL